MRDEIGPWRKIKSFFPIDIRNPNLMKMKLLGERLQREPFLHPWRGVESVNSDSITLNQSKVPNNVLTDAEGIDDRAGADQRRVEGITAIVGANFLKRAVDLHLRRRKSPLRIRAKVLSKLRADVHLQTSFKLPAFLSPHLSQN